MGLKLLSALVLGVISLNAYAVTYTWPQMNSMGTGPACIVDSDSNLYMGGPNGANQYGSLVSTAPAWTALTPTSIKKCELSLSATYALTKTGSIWVAGTNLGTVGVLGYGASTTTAPTFTASPLPGGVTVTDVVAAHGGQMVFALAADGSLYASGENSSGQLGVGTQVDVGSWTLSTTGVAKIASNSSFSTIVKTDGSVLVAGFNSTGAMGILPSGATAKFPNWTATAITTGAASVCSANGYTLVLKTNGSIWAAGTNTYGVFGNGTTTASAGAFVQTVANSGFTSIYCGDYHAFGLKADGTLWGVGRNAIGTTSAALGLPMTTANALTWTQLKTGVTAVAALANGGIAATNDGNLWGTGIGSLGLFGPTNMYTQWTLIVFPGNLTGTSTQTAKKVFTSPYTYGHNPSLKKRIHDY